MNQASRAMLIKLHQRMSTLLSIPLQHLLQQTPQLLNDLRSLNSRAPTIPFCLQESAQAPRIKIARRSVLKPPPRIPEQHGSKASKARPQLTSLSLSLSLQQFLFPNESIASQSYVDSSSLLSGCFFLNRPLYYQRVVY